MAAAIPIVDLFAGPGGLGEGFSSLQTPDGHPVFSVALSIEMDAAFVRKDAETLIDDRLAARLVRLRISHIAIPLDGLGKNPDTIRGRGSFNLAVRGIRSLTQGGLKPTVCFVPMHHNIDDTSELIDSLVREGVCSIDIDDLRPEGRCQQVYSWLAPRYPDDIERLAETVEAKRRAYPEVKITCSATHFFGLLSRTSAIARWDPTARVNRRA